MKFKCLIILLTITSLFLTEFAQAGRFGGGRSFGMRRNFTSPSYNRPQYNHSSPSPQQTAPVQPQRTSGGIGAGTAAVLGAAAGAAGGYMLGKSSSENNNQNQSNQSNGVNSASQVNSDTQQGSVSNNNGFNANHFPWGIVGILVILLVLGLMVFRKSKPGGFGAFQNPSDFNNQNNYNSPTVNSQNVDYNGGNVSRNANIDNNVMNMEKMPDGVEKLYFLRQVKGIFLHVQSMNNKENLYEIKKYLTPELYQDIQSSINDNDAIADFNNLECQLVNCQVEGNQLFASVQFTGMVSENPQLSAVPFSETWNFVKTDINYGKWLVEAIIQN